MNVRKFFWPLFVFFLLQNQAFAKKFASQYCEFELPPNWECALEGTEWVCQSINKARQKEAIIILAAKIRGEQDSLDMYQAYLKQTKTFKLPGGKTQVSEAKYSEVKTVNGHQWIDALHLASEVPGFYTRYLATVKEDLGVAVTFSVGKDHYASYQKVFDDIVSTLRVFRQKNQLAADFKLKKTEENLLDNTDFIADTDQKFGIGNQKNKEGKSSGGDNNTLILIVVLAAAGFGGFKFMQSKKKSNNPPPLKKKKKSSKSDSDPQGKA